MRIKSFIALIVGLGIATAYAQEAFTIHAIRVEGLQRVDVGTVYNELPIEPGDTATTEALSESVRALYQSGFFQDVKLAREGDDLLIIVTERPAIGSIEVTGNKDIRKEDLLKALKSLGIVEGRTFDVSMLERVEKELEQQYFSHGKYNVKIRSTVTPLERNRVAVKINIVEGSAAKIRQITLIGNHDFTEKELLKQFESTTPGLITWYSKLDQYSKERLRGDLEALTSFYMDRGYIDFEITSTQVSITPDKKDIYITITISEGKQYKVKDTRIVGEFVVPEEELKKFILLKPDAVFSRKEMTTTVELLTERVGNEGYAFAKITPIPEKTDDTVSITFFIDPGKRVYVRRINVEGNELTRDDVVRQYLGQMEAAPVSNSKIQASRGGLLRTGFFDEVTIDKTTVPGTTDQVDLDIKLKERRSGKLTGGVGYSQVDGFAVNAGISQDNFLGSGEKVAVDFQHTSASTRYQASLEEPFHTVDAVSRGFQVYYQQTDLAKINVSAYTKDIFGVGVGYGIPLSPLQRMTFGIGYDNSYIKTTTDVSGISLELLDFIEEEGRRFNNYNITSAWVYNKLDRAVYPTKGSANTVSVQFATPGSDLTTYKVSATTKFFQPLFGSFILNGKADVRFGDGYGGTDQLPIIQNFYAGGPGSVRGYRDNTLGPRDTKNNPMGANLLTVASVELIFKFPYLETKSVRTSLFFDAGNVFTTYGDDFVGSTKNDTIRTSAGFATRWLSPMGPLIFSIAKPLNDKPGDQIEAFQFTVGTDF